MVINVGSFLSILDSEFGSNDCKGPLISCYGGTLSLSNNTFIDNVDSPVYVFAANETELVLNTGNCGSENLSCSGVYVARAGEVNCLYTQCKGECIEFDMCSLSNDTYTSLNSTDLPINGSASGAPTATPTMTPVPTASRPTASRLTVECPSNSSLRGYVDMESLQADLGNGATKFQLCPKSEITGSLALSINEETLSIECWDANCIWLGNRFHVRLEGKSYGFRASGITFRGATEDSVVLRYDIDSTPYFVFEDCSWEGNDGSGVFKVYHGNDETSSQRSIDMDNLALGRHRRKTDARRLQDEKQELIGCGFFDNNADEVVIIRTSPLALANCTFQNNIAKESIISAIDSSLTILSTDFIDNTFSASRGIVHIGGDSQLSKDEKVCTLSTNATRVSSCQDIVQEGGNCVDLPKCKHHCVDNWDTLVADIKAALQVVILCANTTIEIPNNTPLILDSNNTVLQCGTMGLRTDECVLNGGSDQLLIAASGIEIVGVTFVGSSRVSVRGEADHNSITYFRDCVFQGHSGVAVIWIDRDAESILSSSKDLTLSGIEPSMASSMNVDMRNCTFIKNKVILSPIFSRGGSAAISSSVFRANDAEVGSIAVTSFGKLDLSNSCFLGNSGNSPNRSLASVISLDASSALIRNERNFGIGNEVTSKNCTNGLTLSSGVCLPFTARFCESSIEDNSDVFTEFSSCVNDFQALDSLLSKPNSTIIEVCPLTVIQLNKQKALKFLRIDRSDVTIKCGRDGSRENDCRVTGGTKHVEITGNVMNVLLQGLTFAGATKSSIVIEGSSPLSVLFADCAWESLKGESVVSVTSIDPRTDSPTGSPTTMANNDDVFTTNEFSGRLLEESTVEVALSRCSFQNNDVTKSLVISKGAMLDVSSCSFSSNRVGDSIVSVEAGRLIIKSTCFEDDGFLVTSDSGTSVESVSNYATSTIKSDNAACAGIFYTDSEECAVFNATFCEAPVDATCFSDWYNLSQALDTARNLGKGSVFKLCQDSLLKADQFNPIELDVDGTVIQCGESGVLADGCTITGGTVQFHVTGNVGFKGVNLLNSSVAAIHAAGDKSRILDIDNCAFSGHAGVASVISYSGDIQDQQGTRHRRTAEFMLPDNGPVMAVNVTDSAFLVNRVTLAPLSAIGGVLTLNSTTFSNNSGTAAAVGVWFGGNIQLSPSCFNSQGTTPSVFVDTGSSIDGIGSTVTQQKASGGRCTGILSGTRCFPIANQNCDIDVILPPARGCYDSWVELGKAINTSSYQVHDMSFSICHDTFLDVNEGNDEDVTPIIVAGVKVEIKCGKLGSRDENCTIHGGRSHFKIIGSGATNFSGVTFEGASFASILASGDAGSVATFTECTWRQNNGKTTILLNSQLDQDASSNVGDLVDLVETSIPGMTVLTDGCIFDGNNVDFGVITNIGGDLNLLETLMVNNRDSRFGVVAAINGATVGLSFTCFTGNSATERGILFLDQNSTLAINRNTFASDNDVSLDEGCNDIFVETEGSCTSLGTCNGDCVGYESRTCRISSFISNSSWEPTSAPSSFPTESPMDDSGTDGVEASPSSGGGKSNGGILAAAILIPLGLLALGIGFLRYKRQSAKVSQDADDDDKYVSEGGAGILGDGSQSRSRTQEIEDEEHSGFEDVPTSDFHGSSPPQHGAKSPIDSSPETFGDEDPVEMVVPLKETSGRSRFSRFGSSRSSLDWGDVAPQPKEFVRIPRNLGKKQHSDDILSFRDIPTTF